MKIHKTLRLATILALLGVTPAGAQTKYPYFTPGGALSCSGSCATQSVNLSAGSSFITGTLPQANLLTCAANQVVYDNASAQLTCSSTLTFNSSTNVLAINGAQAVVAGADLNTTNQVTATHLASPLPVAQGGTAQASNGTAGQALISNAPSAPGWGAPNVLSGTSSSTNACYPVLGANGTTPTFDASFSACINPGLHSFTATTFNGNATNATLAATLTVTSSTTNTNFPPILGNGTTMVFDPGVEVNPSTHTLTAVTFAGALSGNATTATSATTAANLSGSAITTNAAGALNAGGTKFTASGCTNSTTVGGAIAGSFNSGTTGTCTVTITLPTSPGGHGWVCHASDTTSPANLFDQSGTISVTACTLSGTTVSGDVITWSAIAF